MPRDLYGLPRPKRRRPSRGADGLSLHAILLFFIVFMVVIARQ